MYYAKLCLLPSPFDLLRLRTSDINNTYKTSNGTLIPQKLFEFAATAISVVGTPRAFCIKVQLDHTSR